MSKSAKWVLALLAAAAVLATAALVVPPKQQEEDAVARITLDGELVKEIKLNQVGASFSFTVTGASGLTNTILVEKGRIRVEEAEDGETILCQWYNASYETRMVNGVLTPLWVCEKGTADLVREADGWKIWHYFIGTDLQTEAGTAYADQDVDLPDSENPMAVEFGEPTLKMEAYITRYNYYPYPAIPEPYETYRPELGCGPEGNPNYQA